jgi:hypothetical protein
MMDEDEFAAWRAIFDQCLDLAKSDRQEGATIEDLNARFREARLHYSQLTGALDTHQNEIRQHRLSAFGPKCIACGRPLRTPEAKMCAECGHVLGADEAG